MVGRVVLFFCAVMTSVAGVSADGGEEQFSRHWHDGRAEIASYRLQVSRYGHPRSGQAVLIFVTEPFDRRKMVKTDRAGQNSGVVEVVKLNLVRDFQTGIYDYNTMSSVFVETETMTTLKTSFSSAEWCGHVYEEDEFRGSDLRGSILSYFEGESGPIMSRIPPGGIPEEALFILLRGLRGSYLEPGESRRVLLLPSAYVRRLQHRDVDWFEATIKRAQTVARIEVPAGQFLAWRYEVAIRDDRTGEFWVEAEYPHRILRWKMAPDISGELLASDRVAYWKLNGPGDESILEDLKIAIP